MEVETELWALEEEFWTGGVEVYRHGLATDCLMVLPAPAGILERERILEAIAAAPRWKRVRMEQRRSARPMDKTMVLAYAAAAEREDGSHYEALAASVYVYREGTWRLAFHQQTPQSH